MKDEIKEILDTKLYFDLDDEDYTKIQDYITNLQEENENLKDYLKIMEKGKDNNLNRFLDYKSRIDKAINEIQYIIDYGFDYDGFNNVEDLKGLIDELVKLAGESIDILEGDNNERKDN